MSDTGTRLDPEIAGLLGEVARDRDAKLLSGVKSGDVPGLADLREPVSRLSASRAERHLLQVYREEVAWLLRQASGLAIRRLPTTMICNYVGVDEVAAPPTEGELEERIDWSRDRMAGACPPDALEPLTELSKAFPIRPGHAITLAARSLMVLPRSDTRVHLACAQITLGQPASAVTLLRDVVKSGATAQIVSIAWNNLGAISAGEGRWAEARDAQRTSAREYPNPGPAMSWLFHACELGDDTDAIHAGRLIDEMLPPTHPAVDEYLEVQRRDASRRSRISGQVIAGVRDHVGETAGRILNAFE